jgi:thioredoxin-related protein
MKPLSHFLVALVFVLPFVAAGTVFSDEEDEITWYSMEEAQQLADENNKKVLVYVMAEWCGYCKKMEREVFTESTVVQTLQSYYYPVMLDIDSDKVISFNQDSMTEQQFAREYRVTGTPTFFFVDANGEILGAQPGYIPTDVFISLLTYVGNDIYTQMKFDAYLQQQNEDTGSR